MSPDASDILYLQLSASLLERKRLLVQVVGLVDQELDALSTLQHTL